MTDNDIIFQHLRDFAQLNDNDINDSKTILESPENE